MFKSIFNNFRLYIDGKPVFYAKFPEFSFDILEKLCYLTGLDLCLFPGSKKTGIFSNNKIVDIYFEYVQYDQIVTSFVRARIKNVSLKEMVDEPERIASQYRISFDCIESAIIGTPETV